MKQRVVIFGNGKLHASLHTHLKPGDYIVGVDRAAYWLLTRGVVPDIAIGDFDSTSKEEFRRITKSIRIVKKYQPEKNWTDMELAVKHAISRHPSEVVIIGGAGTRHDHTLATLHMLDQFLDARITHAFVDATNRIRLIGRGKTKVEKASYRYISLLPYTKSITVSLSGFRYDVTRQTIRQGTSLGVSNEIRGTRGEIRIFSGKAWLVESND